MRGSSGFYLQRLFFCFRLPDQNFDMSSMIFACALSILWLCVIPNQSVIIKFTGKSDTEMKWEEKSSVKYQKINKWWNVIAITTISKALQIDLKTRILLENWVEMARYMKTPIVAFWEPSRNVFNFHEAATFVFETWPTHIFGFASN